MTSGSRAERSARGHVGAIGLAVTISLVGATPPLGAEAVQVQLPAALMVADFDRHGWRTNAGDPFGTWDVDPDDPTQRCRARLVDEPRVGESGYSLMLDYDVESPNPAFNGFWMKLPSLRLQSFRALTFAIKGDPERGFTQRVKLELKDGRRAAVYQLEGIQPEWVRMRIPLSAFRDIEKIRAATEFVVVFDDQTVTTQVGTVYLDEVAFEP